ncbi:MAG TPA: FHA domain-containing protein [Polyangia bacterium]|jgi:hypothetical protein
MAAIVRLLRWLRGGSDELGWDDLVRRVADEVARLGRYGARGQVSFPPEVNVRITVAEGSLEVIRGFVGRPELDREVEAALANRCDCAPADLPLREYAVAAGAATAITVTEGAARAWELLIEGGDLAGRSVRLPPGQAEARFGRGEWHGPDQHVRNDLVVAQRTEYVSRRAGRLLRAGHVLEVEPLDQGDGLVVRRAAGEALRPARTASGRVPVRAGDVIELGDGHGRAVRLVLRRAEP